MSGFLLEAAEAEARQEVQAIPLTAHAFFLLTPPDGCVCFGLPRQQAGAMRGVVRQERMWAHSCDGTRGGECESVRILQAAGASMCDSSTTLARSEGPPGA